VFLVLFLFCCLQHCCRRCDGCQHRSPWSAQDRTHPRWSCPWYPWGCQGPGQVSRNPSVYLFTALYLYLWWYLGSLCWTMCGSLPLLPNLCLRSAIGQEHWWCVNPVLPANSMFLQASGPSLRPGCQLRRAHVRQTGGGPLCRASDQPDQGKEAT